MVPVKKPSAMSRSSIRLCRDLTLRFAVFRAFIIAVAVLPEYEMVRPSPFALFSLISTLAASLSNSSAAPQ